MIAVAGAREMFVVRPDEAPVLFPVTFIGVMATLFIAYHRRRKLWQLMNRLSLRALTLVHLSRFVGFDFLYNAHLGRLPTGFAYPAGVGDVLVAGTAPIVVWLVARRYAGWRALFIGWNIVGLIDLIVAVTCGVLYSQSKLGILAHGVTTKLLTVFPRCEIPLFFVPIFIGLHLVALSRTKEFE